VDALRIHFLQRTYELGREGAVDTQAVAAAVVDQYLSDTGLLINTPNIVTVN
jgi:hypothetical protein